jgi:PadR family transcriptional regulator, regulatory protein PadR
VRRLLAAWVQSAAMVRQHADQLIGPSHDATVIGSDPLARTRVVDSRHQHRLVSAVDIMSRSPIPDLLPGTLDLLILRTLQTTPLHGWAIAERIQQISQDVLQVNQGSLYPALHRLEHQGWIDAEWRVSELGRRAKYYRLTRSGRRRLAVEASEWERMSGAIDRVMKLA